MTENKNGPEDKVQSFLSMLRTKPTEADCDRCIAQLDAYVTLQLEDGDYRGEFPWVAQHLDSCVDCAEVYAQVYELLGAESNGRLPQPVTIPEPDLSFLDSPVNLWTMLQTALQITHEQITLRLDVVLAALLLPQASPGLVRGGEDGRFGEQLLSLTPEQTPIDLPFSLNAYADRANGELCLVEVTVEPPGKSWPDLGGQEVIVRYLDGMQTAVTDDWGTAVFTNIPRAELQNLILEIHLLTI